MTEEVAALQYRLEATTARFESQIKRAERVMDRSAGNIERRVRQTDSRISRFGERFGAEFGARLIAATGGVAALGTAIRSMVRAGDDIRQLQGRFEALTGSAERAGELVRGAFNVASTTGTGVDVIGGLVTQFRLATEQIGASDAQVLQFTQSLAQLGAIGGSSAQEIANGLRQLSQGLAGGVLRAEEFNSVIENTPLVARALAQELAGGSLGALREMVNEGRVLSEDVFNAILRQSGSINEQFAQIPDNLERATSRLTTSLTEMLAALDDGIGLSETLANVIGRLAREIQEVTDPGRGLREAIAASRANPSRFGPDGFRPEPAPEPTAAEPARPAAASARRGGAAARPARPDRRVTSFDDALAEQQAAQRTAVNRLQIEAIADDEERARRLRALEAELVEVAVAEGLRARAIEQNTAQGRDNTAVTWEQEQAILAAATAAGQMVTQTALLDEAQRRQQESARATARTIEDIGQAFAAGIRQADSFSDALKGVALNLLAIGIETAARAGAARLFPTAAPAVASAKGNVFSGGALVPFARGGIVGGPTTFPMAGGRTGLMGEAGPEAIMPLRRGPGGRLGVEAVGGGGGVTVRNVYHFAPGVDAAQLRAEGERIKRETISAIVRARAENKAFLA